MAAKEIQKKETDNREKKQKKNVLTKPHNHQM